MSLDITDTLAPRSDQLNADDLISGPRTVTITAVSRGDNDQPVNVATAEFGDGRPFKPCKSMRRVMVAAWGPDASKYVGRQLTLYRDDQVKFGGQAMGGIRISQMSHIDRPLTLALTTTRGKRAPYKIDPLPDGPPAITDDAVAGFERRIEQAATTSDLDSIAADLKAWDLGAHRKPLQAAWAKRRDQLQQPAEHTEADK